MSPTPILRLPCCVLTLFLTCTACAQQSPAPPETYPEFPLAAVNDIIDDYRENTLNTRRFKQSDLHTLFNELTDDFSVDTAGFSVQERPLYRVEYGSGPTEVLLWSQMHGDEPTATAALFDLFHWLGGTDEATDSLRQLIRSRLHLTFLPMLNPDGAEVYERRNALGIDLNRDAVHLTSPEAQLLKSERDRLNADWGFNLHDQGVYYSVGFPAEQGAVLSILAPAFDWQKTMSPKREDAAQLIALLNEVWQEFVPGQVGRYNDDFEPRAFGDNLQKWGTRTILIESGGYAGDPEKQEIRRLNVMGLIAGLHGIASGRYESFSVDGYLAIPENQSNGMHETILEDASVELFGGTYRMDIGFRNGERTVGEDNRDYNLTGFVSDLGDLSTFGARDRLDASELRIVPGKVYPGSHSPAAIERLDPESLYRRGYTAVRLDRKPTSADPGKNLRILAPNARLAAAIGYNEPVDLLLYTGSGALAYVVVNGKLMAVD